MRGAIPHLPQYVFMAWCLVEHRDNFYFTVPRLDNVITFAVRGEQRIDIGLSRVKGRRGMRGG
jgi:hypothetical protein